MNFIFFTGSPAYSLESHQPMINKKESRSKDSPNYQGASIYHTISFLTSGVSYPYLKRLHHLSAGYPWHVSDISADNKAGMDSN